MSTVVAGARPLPYNRAAMLQYPDINPVAIEIGPLAIHWYGLMYLVGFAGAWLLMRYRAKHSAGRISGDLIDDLVFFGAIGVIAGARIGYILFYQYQSWLSDPLLLLRVWEGGMSFHGGLIGVVLACWWVARKHGKHMVDLADFGLPMAPIGLGAGRIGNFINGELWGRTTEVPWGMVFPGAGPDPRHPSQLYQAGLEGLVLFAVLWWFSSRPRPRCAVTGLFLLLYGVFRGFVEFFRQPDAHIGYIAFGWLTMGQLLTLPVMLAGAIMLWFAYGRRSREAGA